MPKNNGKRDTQRTETGYEIPVPKCKDVFDLLGKAATKREKPSRSAKGRRRKGPDDQ
jgi:hypothetical protein